MRVNQRISSLVGLGLCLVTIAGCGNIPLLIQKPSTDWVTLFDGSGLGEWVVMHGGQWRIVDGALVGSNGRDWTTDPAKSGSWLRTKQSFRDFELEFEYAISKGGNSGVFFRSAAGANPAFTGYEMQITDHYGREPSKHAAGSIYDVAAPTENRVNRADEWNQVRIHADGAQITIEMNGGKILEHTGDRAKEGYIGLQNHDERSVVRFRNIRVRRI